MVAEVAFELEGAPGDAELRVRNPIRIWNERIRRMRADIPGGTLARRCRAQDVDAVDAERRDRAANQGRDRDLYSARGESQRVGHRGN
jgi:hypothetical protein